MEWISTKKKLPKEGQRVIIYVNGNAFKKIEKSIMYDVRYNNFRGEFYFGGWSKENVSHWMPAPEPPKT